ncbi:MAG TPA: DNA-binding domain-containing protein [Polyangiaceae bacterium]
MNRYAIDVSHVRDRASATLEAKPGRARAADPKPAARRRPAKDAALRDEQLWFARAVMSPDSGEASSLEGEAAERLTASARMGAFDRLDVYRRGYATRLVECLVDDYPVLCHALGEDRFDELCRAYILAHPSDGPNLNFFGRHMAAFCRAEAPEPFPERAFAADLATLEWTIVEVIHAPASDPLTAEGLRDVPMEAWAGARLVANTASKLLAFDYPVNAYFQTVRTDGDPSLPSPLPSATVVYRSGPSVWRMDLTVPMFEVLRSLFGRETLETALSRGHAALGDLDETQAAQRVLAWFREWVSSGLFAGVELG